MIAFNRNASAVGDAYPTIGNLGDATAFDAGSDGKALDGSALDGGDSG